MDSLTGDMLLMATHYAVQQDNLALSRVSNYIEKNLDLIPNDVLVEIGEEVKNVSLESSNYIVSKSISCMINRELYGVN